MRTPDTLNALVDHGIIEEVLRPLMSGKEAQIYLVLSGGEQRVAKIYKEANNRTFQNRADYTEGRKVRNSRDQRAMGSRSKHGRAQNEAAWKSAEVDMIYRLRDAGVRVPVPYHFIDGVLIMELVTDAEGFPAPRLGDLTLEPAEATEIFNKVLAEVVRMLCAGVVHGDLSDFNVLMSADGPVVIDFPQAVDASGNANARKLLLRDVDNLHRFHAKFAPSVEALPYAEEMWDLYSRNALTPDARLTGKFRGSKKIVSTEAVLELIADADYDERRRREGLGRAMRGASAPAQRPVAGPGADARGAPSLARQHDSALRPSPRAPERGPRPQRTEPFPGERAVGPTQAATQNGRGQRNERQPGAAQHGQAARGDRYAGAREPAQRHQAVTPVEESRARPALRGERPATRELAPRQARAPGHEPAAARWPAPPSDQSEQAGAPHERKERAERGAFRAAAPQAPQPSNERAVQRAPSQDEPQRVERPAQRAPARHEQQPRNERPAQRPPAQYEQQPRNERPAQRPPAQYEQQRTERPAQRAPAAYEQQPRNERPAQRPPAQYEQQPRNERHTREPRLPAVQKQAPQEDLNAPRRDLNAAPSARSSGWGQRGDRQVAQREQPRAQAPQNVDRSARAAPQPDGPLTSDEPRDGGFSGSRTRR